MGHLTREMDSQERAERARYLAAWSVEQPSVGLGHVERRCAICNSPWEAVSDGTEACTTDPRHGEMVEKVIEAEAAMPVPDLRSPHRLSWKPWRRSEPPQPVAPDREAQEALERVSGLVGELLEALAAADAACRASTAELEQQTTAAAMAGRSIKREWRPAFKRVASTLRSVMDTVGDTSPDADLSTLRLQLASLELVVRQATEPAQ